MKNVFQPLKFALVHALGIAVGIWFAPYNMNGGNKISQIVDLIKKNYVDTVSVSGLEKEAINDLLHSLDPHSNYFSATEAKHVNEPLEGSFQGIGIEFLLLHDTIVVANVIDDGPAFKAGLATGDKIIKVDEKTLGGLKLNNDEVYKLLKGKEGSQVQLGIYRPSVDKNMDFTVIRGNVAIKSVEAYYMVDKATGYIKIVRFAANTLDEYQDAFKALKSQGLKNLIIDLRDNGGGYLNTAQKLADEFLDEGKVILTTKGEHSGSENYSATSKGGFEKGRLVVLVNENSASASEILSGALQDNDRAVIIGRRTFGKGLVQNTFNLKDGSAIRLTISRYYTPCGRSIQKPYNKGYNEYEEDYEGRYSNGEMFTEDSIKKNKSLVYKTLSGRVVYGGGGIVPDIFVPLDTSGKSPLLADLNENGILREAAFRMVEMNTQNLLRFKDLSGFQQQFILDEPAWKLLQELAIKSKITWNQNDLNRSKMEIEKSIKSLVAKQLFKSKGYYFLRNSYDETFQKALNSISTDKFEAVLLPH